MPATVAARSGTAAVAGPDAFVTFLRLRAPFNLTGPRCLCTIFAAAADALVLVAGPLLEPLVPPLLRVPPLVRDAGPLLEPLVPPLVRLRAGGPAMSYRRCASNSVIFAL